MTTDMMAELAISTSEGAMRVIAYPSALDDLPTLLTDIAPDGEVMILCDTAAKRVGDSALLEALEGLLPPDRPRRTILAREAEHGVVLDEKTVAQASTDLAGAAVILSVGSGTVTDLGKVVADAIGIPLISVQTAASVNGFADPLSVLILNGAKRTVPSTWPTALVIDYDVVAAAPDTLTQAGVGDAVAVWCAPADWYLACEIGMDSGRYDDRYVDPVKRIAPRLADRDATKPERLNALIEALTVGGIVIGGAGTTAPLSGVEHLLSHVLDMSAMAQHAAHDMHGAQVGVSSIISAALWDIALHEDRILDIDPKNLAVPEDLRERVLRTWQSVDASGALGEECWRAVQIKMEHWASIQTDVCRFFEQRDTHSERLESLASDPAKPAEALALWGAPTTFATLHPPVSADRARWALAALPFVRDRMTIADLFVLNNGWNDQLFDRVFDRAAAVGGGLY